MKLVQWISGGVLATAGLCFSLLFLIGEVARQFLDARSQEFNGHFRVSAEGDISYWFNPRIGQAQSSPYGSLDAVSYNSLPNTADPEQEP